MNHFKVSTLISSCGWERAFYILMWWPYEGRISRARDRRPGGQLEVWAGHWVRGAEACTRESGVERVGEEEKATFTGRAGQIADWINR